MDATDLTKDDMKIDWSIRQKIHELTGAKMMIHAAAIVAVGTVGFITGGPTGAATVVVWWAAILVVYWQLRRMKVRDAAGSAKRLQDSVYEDIENVNDILEDIAQRRNWNLEKRMDIARMACENRSTKFDELERRYDQGARSAYSMHKQDRVEQAGR